VSGYLLDTHVLLWLVDDSPRLGPRTREQLTSGAVVHLSAASLWEIEIKARLGKLTVPDDLHERALGAGLVDLPISAAHVVRLRTVELPHRDPFDAMLLAQSRAVGLTLVTADAALLAAVPQEVTDARR